MTKDQKAERVLKLMRGDVKRAKDLEKDGDEMGYTYNEGLARARLSTLFECEIIDNASLIYWNKWINEHL